MAFKNRFPALLGGFAAVWIATGGIASRARANAAPPLPPAAQAEWLEAQARYSEAAEVWERIARMGVRTPMGREALTRAIEIHTVLGPTPTTARLVDRLIAAHRKASPQLCARALFALAQGYARAGDRGRAEKTFRRYLRDFARPDDIDRRLEAQTRVALLVYERACPVPVSDGLCSQVTSVTQPGSKTPVQQVSYPMRNRRLTEEAGALAQAAVTLWAGGRATQRLPLAAPDREARESALLDWAAAAHFLLAELDLEALLRSEPPRGLDFDPASPDHMRASAQALATWLQGHLRISETLIRSYTNVITRVIMPAKGQANSSSPWGVAALSRTGLVYQSFAEQLRGFEVPRNLRKAQAREAYHAALDQYVQPLLQKASVGYQNCLSMAKRLQIESSWTRLCRRELHRLRPNEHTALLELLPPLPAWAPERPALSLEKAVHTLKTRQGDLDAHLALGLHLVSLSLARQGPPADVLSWLRSPGNVPRNTEGAAALQLARVRQKIAPENDLLGEARALRATAALAGLLLAQAGGGPQASAALGRVRLLLTPRQGPTPAAATQPVPWCHTPEKPTPRDTASARTLGLLARLQIRLGRPDEALRSLQTARRCDARFGEDDPLHAFLALERHDFEGALWGARRWLKREPRSGVALLVAGIAARGLAQAPAQAPAQASAPPRSPADWYRQAASFYQRALSAAPLLSETELALGILYGDFLKQPAQARKWFLAYSARPAFQTRPEGRALAKERLRTITLGEQFRRSIDRAR